ncbi:MAG: aromatic amino acid lyase, partial [Acidimicrobiales bacterium]
MDDQPNNQPTPRPAGQPPVLLGGQLSLDDVVLVAGGARVALAPGANERMAASRAVIEEKLRLGEVVYGVTTGFGSLAGVRLGPGPSRELQYGLLRSHAVGNGPLLGAGEVRAMLALRAHVLALGHSGVRPAVAEAFVALCNAGILPAVPERGSLGASGDLAPLAHLALPVIGEGAVLSGRAAAAGSGGPAAAAAGSG